MVEVKVTEISSLKTTGDGQALWVYRQGLCKFEHTPTIMDRLFVWFDFTGNLPPGFSLALRSLHDLVGLPKGKEVPHSLNQLRHPRGWPQRASPSRDRRKNKTRVYSSDR